MLNPEKKPEGGRGSTKVRVTSESTYNAFKDFLDYIFFYLLKLP